MGVRLSTVVMRNAAAWSGTMAALAVLMTISGCGRQGKGAPVGGSDVPPSKVNLKRNVELTPAEQRSIDYAVETVGALEAEAQTEIAAGISGVVDEVLFREGDVVTPETVLVKIDQRRYVSAAEVARANEKRAEANVALAKDVASRAQAAKGSISEEERSRALLTLRVAEAELLAAQASRALAENNLSRSQVRPPYAGRINQRRVTPGTYVEEKTTIATIADLSRIRLVGYIPETAADTVRRLHMQQAARVQANHFGLAVGSFLGCRSLLTTAAALKLVEMGEIPSGYDPEFTLLAFPNRVFRARIFYLSTTANLETRMFEFKAEVDVDDLGVEMRPGYTARVRIPLRTQANACVIPEESVRATERGFVAFVPTQRSGRDGALEWVVRARTLELGYRSPGWVEVRQGITPGELVVRRGAEALEDGMPIRFPGAT